MHKNKLELIILILLVAIGVNYGAFSLYIGPKYEMLKSEREKFYNLRKRVEELKLQEPRLGEIIQENEMLREKVTAIDEFIPGVMDTPQLVNDFYNSCKDYGITGETIIFSGEDTTPANKRNMASAPIILRISGNKYRVEEYLKDISNITKRKLNIRSITLYTEDNIISFSPTIARGLTLIQSENIKAEITFTQYLHAWEYKRNYLG